LGLLLEQVLAKQVGGLLVVPEKVSLKAGMVIGGVNGLILIAVDRIGITIVFPVEQLAATTIVI